jgi:hypothetical protein
VWAILNKTIGRPLPLEFYDINSGDFLSTLENDNKNIGGFISDFLSKESDYKYHVAVIQWPPGMLLSSLVGDRAELK